MRQSKDEPDPIGVGDVVIIKDGCAFDGQRVTVVYCDGETALVSSPEGYIHVPLDKLKKG